MSPSFAVYAARWSLALFMLAAGYFHFRSPGPFVGIVPSFLPNPLAIVYASGAIEILLGAGLLVPTTGRYAAFGLVAFFLAVFPANVNMAWNHLPFGGPVSPVMAWLRLPLQAVFIAWAWFAAGG